MQQFREFRRPLLFSRRFCLAARRDLWLDGSVTALESLIGELKTVCAGLPDQRKGPHVDGHCPPCHVWTAPSDAREK